VRSLSRLRRRSSLRHAAAALAVAAAVWTVVALFTGAHGAALWSSFPVGAVGLGVYAALRGGRWSLGSYAVGLLLTAPALYASIAGVIAIGCFGHAGRAHAWMYAPTRSSGAARLALVAVAGVSVGLWWFIVVAGETCGDSSAATIAEWSGTTVLAVGLAAWQLPRGRAIFWALPAGAVLAGIWFVVTAHVIPGGAGGCFE
jgi:hypothetical protein